MGRAFLYVIIFFSFLKCSFIAKKVYGGKLPKIENEQGIVAWLNKYDLPTEEVVTVDTTGFFYFFPSLAQAPLLFEKTGKFRAAGFSNGKYCPQGVDVYLSRVDLRREIMNPLDSFIVRESYIIPPDKAKNLGSFSKAKFEEIEKTMIANKDTIMMNLFEVNNMLYYLNGSKRGSIKTDGYDFVLILPFAKFYGNKLQVTDLKKYYHSAVKNPNAKFKIVFLNLDKQEWWEKKQMIRSIFRFKTT
jgi:hypothetical protein